MIKFKSGNLIALAKKGDYEVILHGVNCHCKFSDGFALEIAKNFPSVEKADLNTTPLDRDKLGTFIPVEVTFNSKKIIFLNCYTQFNYAGFDIEDIHLFDYAAFRKILKQVSIQYAHKKIAMPLIGTGHAGGNMDKIILIIKEELKNNNVDIIVFNKLEQPKELHSLINKIKCLFF